MTTKPATVAKRSGSTVTAEIHSAEEQLRSRIEDGSARIGVIGLGYVGLPLALTFFERDFPVVGFDVDPAKIEALLAGRSYIEQLDSGRVSAAAGSGAFAATSDFARLSEPDVLIICVPTPLTPQRDPDMSYVIGTAEEIRARLREGQLVVLESTTYPGTTEELLRGILEKSGLRCGTDFFLAYSPERQDPGNPAYSTAQIPKVVGGADPLSGDLAEALYQRVVKQTVRVSSSRTAEATKLLENIFRAVNIALVNELKMVFDKMEIDIWEVLDAAATKPFGFMRFDPGPGLGGHCIPIDPFYLAWKAREYGTSAKFIELAGEINVRMPRYAIEKLQSALNEAGKALKGSRILVLGVAYKKNVDDLRESPALEIIGTLLDLGANVTYHDPHVPLVPRTRGWPALANLASGPLTREALESLDAVLLVTDHAGVDYELVARHAPLIIDTRGVYREGGPNVVKA